jgi:hypothetical protein
MTNARQGFNKILLLDLNKNKTKAMTKKTYPKLELKIIKITGYSTFIYSH